MRTYLTLIVFIISCTVFSQQLVLKSPDAKKIQAQLEKDSTIDEVYYYLLNNFIPTSKQVEKKMFEWKKSQLCAFKQTFGNNIKYAVDQCAEASGLRIKVTFPKMNRKALMKWIEQISRVNSMSNATGNVWKKNNSEFEPKEAEAGCYYSIKETKHNTVVNLYCGC